MIHLIYTLIFRRLSPLGAWRCDKTFSRSKKLENSVFFPLKFFRTLIFGHVIQLLIALSLMFCWIIFAIFLPPSIPRIWVIFSQKLSQLLPPNCAMKLGKPFSQTLINFIDISQRVYSILKNFLYATPSTNPPRRYDRNS